MSWEQIATNHHKHVETGREVEQVRGPGGFHGERPHRVRYRRQPEEHVPQADERGDHVHLVGQPSRAAHGSTPDSSLHDNGIHRQVRQVRQVGQGTARHGRLDTSAGTLIPAPFVVLGVLGVLGG